MPEARVLTPQGHAFGEDLRSSQAEPSAWLDPSVESEASTFAPEDDSDKSCGSLEGAGGRAARPAQAASPAATAGAVVIFDWDDTLLPTSFLQHMARGQTMDEAVRQALRRHALLIEQVLRTARSVAQVSIVTLSRRPWVFQSADRYLLDLDFERLVQELDITIYYAGEHGSVDLDTPPCATHYRMQKRNAIARSLTDWYATGVLGNARLNVLSVGDSVLEKEALKELLGAWGQSGMLAESSFCKTLKLMDQPLMQQLGEELREMVLWLPGLAKHSRGFDICLESPGQLAGQVAAACPGL